MRYTIVSAIVVLAGQSAAQDPYWDEYQFEIRDVNDLFERGFEDNYVLDSRDFDNSYGLTARDYDDNYDLAARNFDDGYYTHATRSYDMDSPVYARDISFITAADFHPRDLFHQNMGSHSWFRPSISPLSKMLNALSTPAHRDHSHLMLQGNHAFMVPPQHDSFDSLFDSFLPQQNMHQSHNTIMAHASVSNAGDGYSCTSSTMIGMDGIPHTTKHCSNTTPDSHVSITIGPSSSSSFDSDSDFFSDPFADLFTDSNPSWHDNVFAGQHTIPKFLRNKRILDLDSAPHRGEIHSFSENDAEHTDHTDEHEESGHEHEHEHENEHDHEHDSLHAKHDLRGLDVHEHEHEHEDEHERDRDLVRILSGKKEKREAEADAEASSEDSAELLTVRDAEAEAVPVGQI